MDFEHEVCLVCSTPNISIHFGIEACRACTSFFKRSLLSGTNFPCRQGLYACDVTRDGKFTCRRCRFDKCLAIGMRYDGPLRHNRKTQEENKESILAMPSTSTDNSFLERIGREFEISVANRQERELAILRKCAEARRLPHPIREVYTGTATCVMRIIPIAIEETWSMFRKSYRALLDLRMHEQMELYRSYLPSFTMVDSFLRAWKVWGTYHEYSMCSITFCVNLRNPDSWFEPYDGGDNRSALISSMALYVRDQITLIVPSLRKAQLKEFEEHALFAIMLCETDMKMEASDQLLSAMDSIREETLRDLQRYYREEMRLTDFSARLGNLMTIVHAVRECSSHFREVFRMQVTLFDVWTAETQLKELLL